MAFRKRLIEIKSLINKASYLQNGDGYEKMYWPIFKEKFPNCETFWKNFVIPFTKRIETNNDNFTESIDFRENTAEILEDISSFHYSVFINLIYAYEHLRNFGFSSFEDYYTHLGSACDLAEDFLLKFYLLILECQKKESKLLQKMTKEEFLKYASNYFDEAYPILYENYYKKGKGVPMNIFSKKNILDEYYSNGVEWNDYKRYTQRIREYRNYIVHGIRIGEIINFGRIVLVPKKEKIQKYKRYSNISSVKNNSSKIQEDFIEIREQMVNDFCEIQKIFNKVWDKPIKDFEKLFFLDKNSTLLEKYNLELIE